MSDARLTADATSGDPSIMDAAYIGRVVRDLADSTKQFVNAVKA